MILTPTRLNTFIHSNCLVFIIKLVQLNSLTGFLMIIYHMKMNCILKLFKKVLSLRNAVIIVMLWYTSYGDRVE